MIMCRYCDGYYTSSKSELIPMEPVTWTDFPVIFGIGSCGGCDDPDDPTSYRPSHADLMALDWYSGEIVLCAPIKFCPMCGRRLWGMDDEVAESRMRMRQ